MKKNNLKKINLQKIKKKLGNIFSSIGSKFKKIKPVEFGVGAVVIVLSCGNSTVTCAVRYKS